MSNGRRLSDTPSPPTSTHMRRKHHLVTSYLRRIGSTAPRYLAYLDLRDAALVVFVRSRAHSRALAFSAFAPPRLTHSTPYQGPSRRPRRRSFPASVTSRFRISPPLRHSRLLRFPALPTPYANGQLPGS
ncbi:hypothetical protein PsYK624_035270 [Phanerochaete sordida]|uniref:Uncharacterized protein n=1 Tax=Phanerochaete sordida TaxID=48140 RepID=A0A9P3LAE2_9APHY|nr:hypothetical protein PsYK624_035270 [Phanerochaete sordida]